MIGLMRLLLLGLIGAGTVYLYKNREARQAAITFGKDVMDVGTDMLGLMPQRYADMASKVGLGRGSGTQLRPTDTGTVVEDPYTGMPPTNDPV